uniref:FAD-dependent oxidoreductase domain-containing protein 1 n=1 Tax=Fundulus heteroclitus TaxID=8078 RepID=A0A3Q2R417_FUNHE
MNVITKNKVKQTGRSFLFTIGLFGSRETIIYITTFSVAVKFLTFCLDLEDQLAAMRKKAADALPGSSWMPFEINPNLPPETADIVIVGGGVVGWSIAYWLKQKERLPRGMRVLVVERDPSVSGPVVTPAPPTLNPSSVSQQEHLGVMNEDPVDLQFNHSGYLFLASVSCYAGLENEGWFDPWSLLNAFRRKAISLGAIQCFGEVTDFKYTTHIRTTADEEQLETRRIKSVKVQMPNSMEYQPVECAIVVNAAGAYSGKLAEMLGIGRGPQDSIYGLPVPVEPRKRYVYVVHCPDGPGLDCPLLIDYSGVYFRREGLGGNYISGISPEEAEEPDTSNLEVDHQFFEDKVWPKLAQRVPAFEKLKVTSAWAGFYDYNTFDQNGIIGIHPLISNMYFATGFSGHGLQHSPAVGRAVAELILDGGFKTLNLKRMSFSRIFAQEPMLEQNIV